MFEELLCARESSADKSERRHSELRDVQMAAVVLSLLRGLSFQWTKSSQERRDHRRKLDWRLCGRRPGTSSARVFVSRNNLSFDYKVTKKPT